MLITWKEDHKISTQFCLHVAKPSVKLKLEKGYHSQKENWQEDHLKPNIKQNRKMKAPMRTHNHSLAIICLHTQIQAKSLV